ncbi:MFS general substrate transporter [Coprinopsis marcescibilis]|uniref:MFS general substrate transporter n=1 Tax=Coprinopsis marcescibilis TaxID=230819 RepID=A0A5C3KIJ9_COPMA|nr:MFS general substrate transporter [Coprinopsis marcescibilis]
MSTQLEKRRSAYGPSKSSDSTEGSFLLDDTAQSSYTTASRGMDAYFDEDLEYTPQEEEGVVQILDSRLFPYILLTTFVLNMDRTNISNAISDNLAEDLGFTIDTINMATAIYAVLFATFCLTGAIASKITGPSRWIPILMFSWGLVTLGHVAIKDKAGYITVRCLIAVTEGGVIPTTLVYLGGFYKGTELATRLAWFWGIQGLAGATSGLMASGLLRLRGLYGLEGWKWLFLVDGIITVTVAVTTWFYLPRDAGRTQGGLRGRKAWFTNKQVHIAVTRLIRDDPSKRGYEKRVSWVDIKDTLSDVGIMGHLLITSIGHTPNTPLHTYFPTIIKSFDFNTYAANALTAPPYILHAIIMIYFVNRSDQKRERGFHGAFSAGWQLAGWIWLRSLDASSSRLLRYLAAVIVSAWPYTHPLNIAWMSENTGSIGKRTVASGLIIGSSNIYGLWGSQIYRADDAPEFKRGNLINIAFSAVAFFLWFYQKGMYAYRNRRNEALWARLSEQERRAEEEAKETKGNRSVLFRFST